MATDSGLSTQSGISYTALLPPEETAEAEQGETVLSLAKGDREVYGVKSGLIVGQSPLDVGVGIYELFRLVHSVGLEAFVGSLQGPPTATQMRDGNLVLR
jgi:hypothetical protein